jgi:hypothetical protein
VPAAETAHSSAPSKRWYKRPRYQIAGGVLAALSLLAACGGDDAPAAAPATTAAPAATAEPATTAATDAPTSTAKPGTTTAKPSTTAAPAPTTTVPPTTTTAKSQVIKAGTYVVGTEIQPGTYRVAKYWARLDANQEIIDNDLTDEGFTLVHVQPTDAFVKFSGPALAMTDSDPVDPIAKGDEGGSYLVGYDVQPGQSQVSSDENAYFARLDESGDIIDNDLGEGSVIVTVQPTDWALEYRGTLELIG